MKRKRNMYYEQTKIPFLIVILFGASYLSFFFLTLKNENNYMNPHPVYSIRRKFSDEKEKEKNVKTVLYYTTFFGIDDFNFGIGQEPFRQCEVNNCLATNDKKFLDSITDFDALLFHSRDIKSIPSRRIPSQRYIFFCMESPIHDGRIPFDSQCPELFNWTMTYRTDSDFFMPYGYFFPKTNQSSYFEPKVIPSELERWKNKKLGVWLVSNCYTESYREDYIAKLRKYISVDVFGKCGSGHLNCQNEGPNGCPKLMAQKYKFYFAFENSACLDYVTEKFYLNVREDIIPVVLGGANYSKLAPPKSYINARDFKDPRDLAQYLLKLDQDYDEYLSYFKWKSYYDIDYNNVVKPFCELCKRLNDPDEPPKVYKEFEKWWRQDACEDKDHFTWIQPSLSRAMQKIIFGK